MRLNLFLRTGQRVLFLISKLRARNPDELYTGLSRIAWEEMISPEEYLCVTSAVDNPTVRDSRLANQRCKDAIVDRIKRKLGRRRTPGLEKRRGGGRPLLERGSLSGLPRRFGGAPLPAGLPENPAPAAHAGDIGCGRSPGDRLEGAETSSTPCAAARRWQSRRRSSPFRERPACSGEISDSCISRGLTRTPGKRFSGKHPGVENRGRASWSRRM